MGIDRRQFLQQTGLILFPWGIKGKLPFSFAPSLRSQILSQSHLLASSSNRKLALLVGINQYNQQQNLHGCLTDVEEQEVLLRDRFGFAATDILTLKDTSATRDRIVSSFKEHLIKQAQPHDIVVFHFSGYGTKARIPATEESGDYPEVVNCLVPSDSDVSSVWSQESYLLLESTLAMLARSLLTEKVTIVIDASYLATNQLLQGNLTVRSLNQSSPVILKKSDFIFAQSLREELNQPPVSQENLINQPHTLQGVVMTATGPQQIATEMNWGGFHGGVFTHTLTHSLWEAIAASNIQISLTRSAQTIERLLGPQQQPRLFGKDQGTAIAPYYTFSKLFGSEAVITEIEGQDTVQLSLVGIPPAVLKDDSPNSVFSLPNRPGVEVKLISREGLRGKGYCPQSSITLTVGEGLQEQIRVIPRNPGLVVALETNLGRIERVDATSAFSDVGEVSSVIVAGEGSADYLFSKGQALQGNPPMSNLAENGYGLFSVGGIPIPSTVGTQMEAVKSAVLRLIPKLKTLLAAKLCQLSVNEGSSQLGLKATLETIAPKATPVIGQETFRYRQGTEVFFDTPSLPYGLAGAFPQIPTGSQIQYRLENISDRAIYCLLLGVDSGANPLCFYNPDVSSVSDPSQSTEPLQDIKLSPGEVRVVPKTEASYKWRIPGPTGLSEIYVIGSREPFTKTLQVLSQIPHSKGQGERVIDLADPLTVVQAVQEDLQTASLVSSDLTNGDSSVYALDVRSWATLSFVYQVV